MGRGKYSALARGCETQIIAPSQSWLIYLPLRDALLHNLVPRLPPWGQQVCIHRRARVWPYLVGFTFTDHGRCLRSTGLPETWPPTDSRRKWAGSLEGPSAPFPRDFPQVPFPNWHHEIYPFQQNEPQVLGGPAVEMTMVSQFPIFVFLRWLTQPIGRSIRKAEVHNVIAFPQHSSRQDTQVMPDGLSQSPLLLPSTEPGAGLAVAHLIHRST